MSDLLEVCDLTYSFIVTEWSGKIGRTVITGNFSLVVNATMLFIGDGCSVCVCGWVVGSCGWLFLAGKAPPIFSYSGSMLSYPIIVECISLMPK